MKLKICVPPSKRSSLCLFQREVLFVSLTASSTSTPHLKEKFSLHISIFHSLLPYPQRELLVVSLKNLSPPSKRSSLCLFQREVLFVSLTASSTSTPHLKEKFSLHISIFHSLLSHRQPELLVVWLKNLSPPSKRSSLCLFQFFTLSYPTLNERFSLSR